MLKKVNKVNNVEVNIKTCHITYGMPRDFNLEGHNITIAFYLGCKLRWAYRHIRIKFAKLG